MEKCERLRSLGCLERYSTSRNHLGFYNNVAVTADYSSSKCAATQDYIRSALGAVIREHPILSAVPVNEDTDDPYFIRLQEIKLEDCLVFIQRTRSYDDTASDPEIDELLSSHHNWAFKLSNPPRPFWRLAVLSPVSNTNTFTASFVYHHALGDGLSGKAFHESFQRSLSRSKALSGEYTLKSSAEPLIPELEKLHKLPVSPVRLIKALYDDYFGQTSKDLWAGKPISTPLISHFVSTTISAEVASRFYKACRHEKVTVTSTLSALVASAIFKFIPTIYTELRCQLPISFRRWIKGPVTESSMGVYVASLQKTFNRGDFSWDEARKVRQSITKFLATEGNDADVSLLRWVNDYKKHFCSKLGRNRSSSFEISNLGQTQSPEHMEWNIGRVVFSQCASVTGSALEVCVAGGGDGSLTLGYAWQEDIVEHDLVFQVQEEVRVHILHLTNYIIETEF